MADGGTRITLCGVCGKRPGTIKWGDALSLSHGFYDWRCSTCVARAQLRHAWLRTLQIPALLWRSR